MKINYICNEYKRYISNFNTNLNESMNFRNNDEHQELNNLQGNKALKNKMLGRSLGTNLI